MKPISDTSDEELNAKLETHVRNDRLFSWLVVLALISEAILTWAFRRENLEAVSLILANLAIAVGVFGEIHSGRKEKMISGELDRRSKLRIAEANENARRLELEIAEQREKAALAERALLELKNRVNDRHVGPERFWPIYHALVDPATDRIPKYSISVFCLGESSEPCRFAAEIVAALRVFCASVRFENPGIIPESTRMTSSTENDPGIAIKARSSETILAWFKIMKAAGAIGCRGIEDSTLAPDEVHLIVTERRVESYATSNNVTIEINTNPA
jgi:hypothetical protein